MSGRRAAIDRCFSGATVEAFIGCFADASGQDLDGFRRAHTRLPVVQAVYFSFFRWNGLGPLQNFTGLANYGRALGDRSRLTPFSR